MVDFQRGFLMRMKQRLGENDHIEPGANIELELQRVVNKYWELQGPKVKENEYRDD